MKWSALWVSMLLLGSGLALAEPEHYEGGDSGTEKVEQLERNVRLEFKLVPLDEGDQASYVLAASPNFRTLTRYQNEEFEVLFEVSGRIDLVDDDRIFLAYEAHVEFDGDDEEAEMIVSSSVLLKPGKATAAARMGEKTLMVTASYVADEK